MDNTIQKQQLKIKTIEFKENNNRTYAVCISSKKTTQKENAYIKGKINKNVYYINIDRNGYSYFRV